MLAVLAMVWAAEQFSFHQCRLLGLGMGFSLRVDWLAHCYCLDKWLNCLAVGVTLCGSAVHMTHVSYTSHASVRGLVSGHWSSQSDLVGYLNLVSG